MHERTAQTLLTIASDMLSEPTACALFYEKSEKISKMQTTFRSPTPAVGTVKTFCILEIPKQPILVIGRKIPDQ